MKIKILLTIITNLTSSFQLIVLHSIHFHWRGVVIIVFFGITSQPGSGNWRRDSFGVNKRLWFILICRWNMHDNVCSLRNSTATGNFVREWTVRESTGDFSYGNGRYGNSRTLFYDHEVATFSFAHAHCIAQIRYNAICSWRHYTSRHCCQLNSL